MPIVGTDIPQAKRDALANDAPVFMAKNLVADASSLRWTQGTNVTSVSITDPNYPIDGIHDYSIASPTRPTTLNGTTWYVSGVLPAQEEIDCAVVHVSNITGSLSVQLHFSDTNDWTQPFQTVGETQVVAGSVATPIGARFSWLGLDGGSVAQQYGSTGGDAIRFRVSLSFGATVTSPFVNEVFIGRMRIFSRPWLGDSDLDDFSQGSDYTEFVARNRDRARYVLADGFADHTAQMDFGGTGNNSGEDLFGLDDLDTSRLIRDETLSGARSFWYRQRRVTPVRLMVANRDLNAPIIGGASFRRRMVFDMSELPPFAAKETVPLSSDTSIAASGAIFALGGSADLTEVGASTGLIDGYTWDHAWAFDQAPGTPGDIPALAGGIDLPFTSGTYTTSASTGTLASAAIGAARVNEAIDNTDAEFGSSNAGFAHSGGFHLRAIVNWTSGTDQRVFRLGTTDRVEIFFTAAGSLVADYIASSALVQRCLISAGANGWKLIDYTVKLDGGSGTTASVFINGAAQTPAASGTNYAGMPSVDLDVLHNNGVQNFSGDVLFVGWRTDTSFVEATHDSDFASSGL